MNRIKAWAFVAAIIGMLGTSCYEDKGNYDYQVLNELTINLPLETTDYVLGDVLKITPELTFLLGEKTSDLSYSWTFEGVEISTEPVLNWTVNLEGKYKNLRLAVKDEATGVTYYGSNIISVTTPYASAAWVALSEKDDGTSMLSYMRPIRMDDAYSLAVTKDVYGLANNGASLGGTPISISQHFASPWGGEDVTSWLWVNQTGGLGCVDLNGSTYQKEVTLQDIFINKIYPEGFQPQRVYDFQWLTMAVGTNGEVYTRVKDNTELFHNNYILDDRVLKYKQTPVDGSMLNITPSFAEHGGLLMFDKNTHRYYHISDYKGEVYVWGQGYVTKSYVGNVLQLEAWNEPFDDMSGYTVHYIGAYKGNWSMKYKSLVEKDGHFYLQDFEIDDYAGGSYAPGAYTYSMTDITAETADGATFGSLMGNGRNNCFELCYYQDDDRPYLLFSSGNELYLYYFKGDVGKRFIKFASFDSSVSAVKTGGGAYEGHAGVGLENGDFYVLDLDSSVVEEVIKTGDSDKKVLFKQSGLGRKVVDVIFKMERARDSGSWY